MIGIQLIDRIVLQFCSEKTTTKVYIKYVWCYTIFNELRD